MLDLVRRFVYSRHFQSNLNKLMVVTSFAVFLLLFIGAFWLAGGFLWLETWSAEAVIMLAVASFLGGLACALPIAVSLEYRILEYIAMRQFPRG